MKAEVFRKDLFEDVNSSAHELSQVGEENAEQFVPWARKVSPIAALSHRLPLADRAHTLS
jgi:hypothetical protein